MSRQAILTPVFQLHCRTWIAQQSTVFWLCMSICPTKAANNVQESVTSWGKPHRHIMNTYSKAYWSMPSVYEECHRKTRRMDLDTDWGRQRESDCISSNCPLKSPVQRKTAWDQIHLNSITRNRQKKWKYRETEKIERDKSLQVYYHCFLTNYVLIDFLPSFKVLQHLSCRTMLYWISDK